MQKDWHSASVSVKISWSGFPTFMLVKLRNVTSVLIHDVDFLTHPCPWSSPSGMGANPGKHLQPIWLFLLHMPKLPQES